MTTILDQQWKETNKKYSQKAFLKTLEKEYRFIKEYDFFGNEEYTFYTANGREVGCYDINTKKTFLR
jgi:hypothetical protein